MRFLLLIYGDEGRVPERDSEPARAEHDGYASFNDDLGAAEAYLWAEALRPVGAARTVRIQHGEPIATDGPFAETKEQLAGFYVIECADMAAALEWAARVPGVGRGSVEVRPVYEDVRDIWFGNDNEEAQR